MALPTNKYAAYVGVLNKYPNALKIINQTAIDYSKSFVTIAANEPPTACAPLLWGRKRGIVPNRPNGTWGHLTPIG